MDSKVLQYSVKIKTLLRKLLSSNFQLRADVDFKTLLSHLAGKEDPELGKRLLGLDLFAEWIVQACSYWEKHVIHPSPNICAFALELLGLISRTEGKFLQLNSSNIYLRLIDIVRVRGHSSTPSVKLAFVTLLSSLLEHKSGLKWIIVNSMWTEVLTFCLTNTTINVIKESSVFIYQFLEKLTGYHERCLENAIKKIMQHLIIDELKSTVNVDEERIKVKLTPTLRLIVFILEQYCQNESTQKRKDLIPRLFLEKYHLEQIVNSYMMIVKNEEFSFELENIIVLIYFIEVCTGIEGKESTTHVEQLETLDMKVLKMLATDVSNRYNLNVIKVSHLCVRYLKFMKSKFPLEVANFEKSLAIFENKIMLFQIGPICMISDICAISYIEMEINELRDDYITKFFNAMCHHTIRIAYSWRNQLIAEKNVFETSMQGLSYFVQSRQYCTKDMGFVAFQSIMYGIEDLVNTMKDNQQLIDTCIKESTGMYMLFDALEKTIEDFEITWRDCVETTSVMDTAIDFINLTHWPPKVVVQVLKVVNLSISKYMSPNLALLVDRTYDSAMDTLGPLLTTKLQDEHWEVRDTALEVLCTISEIAHTKFPSFQKFVLQGEFPKFVANMCTTDCQSFVRTSALKCVQKMIIVSAFWCQVLDNVEILKNIQCILNEDTDAIVRAEAAALIAKIYIHHSFPEEMEKEIYDVMVYSATLDLYWEVKVKALEFWDAVIQEKLKNQGMIDGSFPSVTFSKENRKIITLTETEIQKRLHKVLLQLSDCGCLDLLVSAIQDDCDIEVVKQAVDITKRLSQLMERYNVCFSASKEASSSGASTVSLGSRSMNKIVSPAYFTDFVKQDFDELVNARKKLLNGMDSLSSVLDDMLKSEDEIHKDVNEMDYFSI